MLAELLSMGHDMLTRTSSALIGHSGDCGYGHFPHPRREAAKPWSWSWYFHLGVGKDLSLMALLVAALLLIRDLSPGMTPWDALRN
jgi:hypothetical protein